MQHVLVVDVGTSSVKAAAFDRSGALAREAEIGYPTANLGAGRHEQSPLDWRMATRSAIRRLAVGADNVELIVLAGTMQSVIPLDGDGQPVRPAILYSDGRAAAELDALLPAFSAQGGAAIIANAPNEYMTVFKIAWLRRHEPDAFARTAMFHAGAKDCLAHWLTGEHVTDPTAGSTVGLMDASRLDWSPALMELVGVRRDQLPRICAGHAVAGALGRQAALELGLKAGTPVLNGSGDAGASTLGAGIAREGESYVYVGTTAWAAQITPVLKADPKLPDAIYTLAHPSGDGRAIRIGAMLSGGDSAAWFGDATGRELSHLDARLADPGFRPSQALFLPYLKGERCPFTDSAVRGAFLQLGRDDDLATMHYAVLEGVSLAIRSNFDSIGPVTGDVLLLGGAALSDHLPQLLANAIERPVRVARSPGSITAAGAYQLAAQHLGWPRPQLDIADRIEPDPQAASRTRSRLSLFHEATALARRVASLA